MTDDQSANACFNLARTLHRLGKEPEAAHWFEEGERRQRLAPV